MFIDIVESGDDLLQHLRRRNQEHRAAHVPRECAFVFAGEVLDKRKDLLPDNVKNLAAVAVLEFAPAHGLPVFRIREDMRKRLAGEVFEMSVQILSTLFLISPVIMGASCERL